ncbi:MAG TPA: hypothetical protein VK162_14525, partial [Streptosporangiaceae bacterium]|nr:hypothetical protein [Streptosporangiaceae bacterium]
VSPGKAAEARDNFHYAYLAGAVKVLRQLGAADVPDLPAPVPANWYPEVSGWEGMVAGNLEAWIRAEFGSLIRAVLDANEYRQPALCWRIAARLGDCFSPPARHADVKEAFEVALAAARTSVGSPSAEMQVRLARSGYLTAVHDYSAAIAELKGIAEMADGLNDQAVKAEALRRLAHALQEIGHYERAIRPLEEGRSAARYAGDRESRLIELLRGENDALRNPDHWMARISTDGLRPDLRDNSQFTERIILGRASRRRRDCQVSDGFMKDARRYSAENLVSRALNSGHKLVMTSPCLSCRGSW